MAAQITSFGNPKSGEVRTVIDSTQQTTSAHETSSLVFQNSQGRSVTTSLIVAHAFGKEHYKVVKSIEALLCSDDFLSANFGVSFTIRELPNGGSKKERFYEMTKNGFCFLAMGYIGKKAAVIKELFINEFDKKSVSFPVEDGTQQATSAHEMSELVSLDSHGRSITTSLLVAQAFGKEHFHVLRDIDELLCSTDFHKSNFGLMLRTRELPNGGRREERYYEMTKDGFCFLVMGYTGEKAAAFKEKFIDEFNKRDALLRSDDYILERARQIRMSRGEVSDASHSQELSPVSPSELILRLAEMNVEHEHKLREFESRLRNAGLALMSKKGGAL